MPTWIRVRDKDTGHEFDINPRAMREGLERVESENYPDLSGPGARPRPTKVRVAKDGKPAKRTAPAQQPAEKTQGSE